MVDEHSMLLYKKRGRRVNNCTICCSCGTYFEIFDAITNQYKGKKRYRLMFIYLFPHRTHPTSPVAYIAGYGPFSYKIPSPIHVRA